MAHCGVKVQSGCTDVPGETRPDSRVQGELMKKRIGAVVAGSALILGACGSGGSNETLASVGADDQVEIGAAAQSDLANVAPVTGDLRSVLLKEALDPANELASARFEGRFTMVGAAGSEFPGEMTIGFDGAYDLANDSSELSMDLSGMLDAMAASEGGGGADMAFMSGFFAEPLQIITIGDQSWMKWGLFSMFTGSGDSWLEGEAGELGESVDISGFGGGGSPVEMLEVFADANVVVEVIGTEDLRGVETTHYRAMVNPQTLMASMSEGDVDDFASDFGTVPNAEFPIDFWLGPNELIHRYVIDLSGPGVISDPEGELESATFTFEMWDHGTDLNIVPPPADQIVSEDELNFGFGDSGEA